MFSKLDPSSLTGSKGDLPAQTLLFEGCRELDYEKVSRAIDQGADVNRMASYISGDTVIYTIENVCFSPLSLVAMHGRTQLLRAQTSDEQAVNIASLLLKQGAKLTTLDMGDMGNSPLHWAITTFKGKLCNLFIQHAVSTRSNVINLPNQPVNPNYGSHPPLILALKVYSQYLVHKTYHSNVAELLIKAGADVDATDNHQQSALHWAAILRMPENFFKLLTARTKNYCPNEFEKTPKELYDTVLTANILGDRHLTSFSNLNEFIVDWFSDTNRMYDRECALECRNTNYQPAVAKMLNQLDGSMEINRATLNTLDHLGRTKLHRAVFSANLEAVKNLLTMECDVTIKDFSGFTALELAQHLETKFTLDVAPELSGGQVRAAQCDIWEKISNVISSHCIALEKNVKPLSLPSEGEKEKLDTTANQGSSGAESARQETLSDRLPQEAAIILSEGCVDKGIKSYKFAIKFDGETKSFLTIDTLDTTFLNLRFYVGEKLMRSPKDLTLELVKNAPVDFKDNSDNILCDWQKISEIISDEQMENEIHITAFDHGINRFHRREDEYAKRVSLNRNINAQFVDMVLFDKKPGTCCVWTMCEGKKESVHLSYVAMDQRIKTNLLNPSCQDIRPYYSSYLTQNFLDEISELQGITLTYISTPTIKLYITYFYTVLALAQGMKNESDPLFCFPTEIVQNILFRVAPEQISRRSTENILSQCLCIIFNSQAIKNKSPAKIDMTNPFFIKDHNLEISFRKVKESGIKPVWILSINDGKGKKSILIDNESFQQEIALHLTNKSLNLVADILKSKGSNITLDMSKLLDAHCQRLTNLSLEIIDDKEKKQTPLSIPALIDNSPRKVLTMQNENSEICFIWGDNHFIGHGLVITLCQSFACMELELSNGPRCVKVDLFKKDAFPWLTEKSLQTLMNVLIKESTDWMRRMSCNGTKDVLEAIDILKPAVKLEQAEKTELSIFNQCRANNSFFNRLPNNVIKLVSNFTAGGLKSGNCT